MCTDEPHVVLMQRRTNYNKILSHQGMGLALTGVLIIYQLLWSDNSLLRTLHCLAGPVSDP